MKYLIMTISLAAALLPKHHRSDNGFAHFGDSIFIDLPAHYDTLNVSFIGKNISRIIFDNFSQKSYTAPAGTSLDVQRKTSFAYPSNGLPKRISRKIVDLHIVSDSLKASPHLFFHRHTFFVIITKRDTCYFYHAKGQYLDKNFDNDTQ